MDFEDEFFINGKRITTYVTKSVKRINRVLELLAGNAKTKVIGLDIELHMPTNVRNPTVQCATLNLCAESTCLIIPLLHLHSVPVSLNILLCCHQYTFVGVGINEKLNELEKQFGVRCTDAVELGPLAASVLDMPFLRSFGVDELYFVVANFDLRSQKVGKEHSEDWGGYVLSIQQSERGAINVYSCYEIGRKLFEKNNKRFMKSNGLSFMGRRPMKKKLGWCRLLLYCFIGRIVIVALSEAHKNKYDILF